ncbi:MAG: formylglycine-generating enzyme family protein [Candidatus Eisenbacteria bacterium]
MNLSRGNLRAATGLAALAGLLMLAEPVRAARATPPPRMVRIPAGSYLPLYSPPPADAGTNSLPARRKPVVAFLMDVRPVTNAEFLAFVREHPEWRRSRVRPLFADAGYLRHWSDDLVPGDLALANSPVVNVSWFAARAFLNAHGKQLPSVDQWEYVAAASESRRDASRDSTFLDRLRRWYASPSPSRLPAVGTTFRNFYGLEDMHGLIWEWTLDFNSALVTGESRGDNSLERSLYCGAGAAGATDFKNYAAFMRFAFRSSLQARYGVANLGFRGVQAAKVETP